MSKERELIDKYNELEELINKRIIRDATTMKFETEKFRTLFELSEYQKNNIDNIEDTVLFDKTMLKGINNVMYFKDHYYKPIDITPPTYHKLENNKVMIISDLHYISRKIGFYKYHEDSIYYLNTALNYAKEHDIKEVIVLGDLIDGKYSISSNLALNNIIKSKSKEDLLNEITFITNYIRKELPGITIRAILGNHDMNALTNYQTKYENYNKGIDEFIRPFNESNIKIDGAGNVIYNFGENKLVCEHDINKPFGIYNPLEVEYPNDVIYSPYSNYRSISGHGHMFKCRTNINSDNNTANVMCPCLKGDFEIDNRSSNLVEYPGFLIVYSVNDKILVEPYFINKINNEYYVDTLDRLSERAKYEKNIPKKYMDYYGEKRIVLNKTAF